jgi:electron transport complex protein RnfC
MIRRLFTFKGGVHPPQHKQESTSRPVRPASLPKQLILPLHQHIGESAEPIVKVGDHVLKGEKIARAQGYVSAPVHASSSGTVVAIESRPIPHPSGLSDTCIVIETDGEERWIEHGPEATPYTEMDVSHLRNLIRTAGIVGLGGAGFPSYIKLNPAGGQIDTLILNGVECEPYITCDDMLMRERPEEIIAGAKIMRHALQAKAVVIAIEDNKPAAYAALVQASKEEKIEVVQVPTLYPAGSEKQLIRVITGKEVPSNGLPVQIGVVVHNAATATAVHNAINLGKPLISRIVTVAGDGIAEPCNLEVPFGTPMQHLLDQCGADNDAIERVIMGGPMMGFAMHTTDIPVIKTTNCVLAATHANVTPPSAVMPCIRCGACADACPVELLPQQLLWYARSKEFDRTQEYNLFDCIECGCCAYVCPSNIPLVHYYRYAKTEIWAQEREKEKADLARQRHEFRLARIEREQAEKKARLAKKKEAVKPAPATDDKQAAIQAALERAQAKKAAKGTEPKNTANLNTDQQQQIDEADARRANAAQHKGGEQE